MASIYRRKPGGPYYVTYFERPGKRRTVKGSRDRAATEALARKLESDAMLRAYGVIDAKADRCAKAEARPLVVKDADGEVRDGQLADFYNSLIAKGTTQKQAKLVRTRATAIIEQCDAQYISDLTPSAVQTAIAELRKKEALSYQTCNHYLRAIKQFSRWLYRDRRTREDALAHLPGYNAALDRRHQRRALNDDEIARLLQAAEKGKPVRGMTGPDRAMLYRLALGTGFRASELASLVPDSFNLGGRPPTVTVEAGYSKHRRRDVQPIRRDLADLLRPWIEGKTPGLPVFNMPDKPVKLVQADLAAAREAWIEEAASEKERDEREKSSFLEYRDAAGHVADFHALRHTFISRLVRSGANIKVAQELARHSTPTLTLGRYAHVQLADQTRALDALPAIEQRCTARRPLQAASTNSA